MGELSGLAKFLGLDKGSQRSVSDQLQALATLKDFVADLAKGKDALARREAEAARKARLKPVKPTLNAVAAAAKMMAAAKQEGDGEYF